MHKIDNHQHDIIVIIVFFLYLMTWNSKKFSFS